MSSEKEMNDMKDSIKKLNNTIKDLTQLLSPENLDLLDLAIKALRTEHAKEQQAKEQHVKNEKRYEFIRKRRDEINQNKSEVQSAQSLMSEVAENLTADEQLKSDLQLSQALQVDTANRLASLLVEYEKVKAEHGELAQKCESKKHELSLRDEEAKAKAKEAKRLWDNVRKRKRKFSELDDHEDQSSN
jgi:hypothetical protein